MYGSTKERLAGRKSDENSDIFHENQNIFYKRKVIPLQEFMGIFRFSADQRILRDYQDNPEAS